MFALEGDQTDEDLEDIDPEDPEMNDEESDLLLKFSRMRLKVKTINSRWFNMTQNFILNCH